MKRVLLSIAVVLLMLTLIAGAFMLGRNTQYSNSEQMLEGAQAILSFNHAQRYREIEDDLSKGCLAEALEKARISKDQELVLLSSFIKEHPNTEFKYASDRDPKLIEQMKTFKSKYGSSWSEPKCPR